MPPRKGSSRASTEAAAPYDASYFINYMPNGRPYGRDEEWLEFFRRIADRIVADIQPKTVLDAGCALGFLVEALRDRGVEAYGFDVSEYALGQVRPDIREFVWRQSILHPLPQRYDLIVNIEVVEHLPAQDSVKAVENLSAFTDDVIFASTPSDFHEPTHLNVRPPGYWTELFARQGMYRDVDYDLSTWLAPWAVRYRRLADGVPRLVGAYDRLLWQLRQENLALREDVQEIRSARARLREVEQEMAAFKASGTYQAASRIRSLARTVLPLDTRAGVVARRMATRFGRRHQDSEDGG